MCKGAALHSWRLHLQLGMYAADALLVEDQDVCSSHRRALLERPPYCDIPTCSEVSNIDRAVCVTIAKAAR